MALVYSEYLQVSHQTLSLKGVYDGALDQDYMLHIDPLLLKTCKVPEFKGAYEEFLSYFNRFITLVPFVKKHSTSDRFYKRIYEGFQFPELPNTGLGYSTQNTHGNGISGKIAKQLAESTIEIVNAGFQDTEIFAIMPLFEENIGADRISDMTISILYDRFIDYTKRISKELSLSVSGFKYKGSVIGLPSYKRRPIIFIPTSILTDLPHALDYDDVGRVCDYNRNLRIRIGTQIGLTLKEAASLKKTELKKLLLGNPVCMSEAIQAYKRYVGVAYDFYEDKKDKYLDARLASLPQQYPLAFKSSEPILETTRRILLQFKSLVEDNYMWRIFRKRNYHPIETDWQYYIYSIADTYIKAANLDIDLNRENNPGVGQLDFKLSRGAKGKTVVEIKRSSNQDLLHGYVTQLPLYMKAEKADFGFFVIIDEDNRNQEAIQFVQDKYDSLVASGEYAPEIIIVDARPRESASKVK